jgi:hypothetical protein
MMSLLGIFPSVYIYTDGKRKKKSSVRLYIYGRKTENGKGNSNKDFKKIVIRECKRSCEIVGETEDFLPPSRFALFFPSLGGGGGKVLEALFFPFSYAFSNASREVSDVSKNAFFPYFWTHLGKCQKCQKMPFSPRFLTLPRSGGSGGKCFFLWVFRRILGGRRRLALLGVLFLSILRY